MKTDQSIHVNHGKGMKRVTVAVATILTGSFLSLSLGLFTVGTVVQVIWGVQTAAALTGDEDRRVNRDLRKAERQLKKMRRAQRKADKHGKKADDAMDSAEETINNSGNSVRDRQDDPECHQPGVQC
ncbi:MAG: hypothetical protein ACPGYT_14205 [Nitrospirales bacterium]